MKFRTYLLVFASLLLATPALAQGNDQVLNEGAGVIACTDASRREQRCSGFSSRAASRRPRNSTVLGGLHDDIRI